MYKKEISERENMLLVLDGKQPAWIPSYFEACAGLNYQGVLARKKDEATGLMVDTFGVKFTSTVDGPVPLNTQTRDFELKDITKWKSIMPQIDLSKIDWETEAAAMMKNVKEGQMTNFSAGTVWEELHYMMGYEEALYSLAAEPEAAQECLFAIADFRIDAMRRVCKYIKPDMIMFMEHVANALGLLMSPETYRSVLKPVHKKMYDAIIDLGCAYPEMHVDGKVDDIVPDYVEMGIKVIQPFQVFNDIEGAKKKYGMVAIGGWNAVGPGNQASTTEEEARASVRKAMDDYGPSGRYAFWQSGVTPRFADVGKWIADEAANYGVNFYHK